MSAPAPRGRLSVQLLLWFLCISLVPVGALGWHLINTSMRIVREVSLRNQQSNAARFGETVSLTLKGLEEVLTQTARLGDFATTSAAQKEQYLLRVMQFNPDFFELSVLDLSGRETVRFGRFRQERSGVRNFADSAAFQTALKEGRYLGGLERVQGLYPALTIAVPILVEGPEDSDSEARGVLIGKVNLSRLSNILRKEISEKDPRKAAIAAPDGFLVAHSDPDEIYRPDASLPEPVLKRLSGDKGRKGGEIRLPGGSTVLGAFASVPETGWIVYVQQPLEVAYRAATQMRVQIAQTLFWVVIITALLSLAVSAHITLPIRDLRQAADQLRVGRFENLPELTLTNDEIGDLGQSFFQMSESLREKTEELLDARDQLERFRGTLEKRVEARTRELKAAQGELVNKERLAAMGEMATVVGHEIRNPLAVINNSIFFIKTKLGKENRLEEKVSHYIKIIESEIHQASSIINEILSYSRTREMKPQPVRVNRFLEEILSLHPLPPQIRVAKELDPRDPSVIMDPDEVRQAVRNLLGNAVDAMQGGGTLLVRSEAVGKDWVRLDVQDSGSGIAPDVMENMFSPFYTTKARGTGLGLAVVRKVVDRHNGKVEAASTVGKGTVFRLFLPVDMNRRPADAKADQAAA